MSGCDFGIAGVNRLLAIPFWVSLCVTPHWAFCCLETSPNGRWWCELGTDAFPQAATVFFRDGSPMWESPWWSLAGRAKALIHWNSWLRVEALFVESLARNPHLCGVVHGFCWSVLTNPMLCLFLNPRWIISFLSFCYLMPDYRWFVIYIYISHYTHSPYPPVYHHYTPFRHK